MSLKFFVTSVDEQDDGVRGPQRVAVIPHQPPSTHFSEAHGESVAQGRARAQQMRAKLAAKSPAPANDTDTTDKTGTNDA